MKTTILCLGFVAACSGEAVDAASDANHETQGDSTAYTGDAGVEIADASAHATVSLVGTWLVTSQFSATNCQKPVSTVPHGATWQVAQHPISGALDVQVAGDLFVALQGSERTYGVHVLGVYSDEIMQADLSFADTNHFRGDVTITTGAATNNCTINRTLLGVRQ